MNEQPTAATVKQARDLLATQSKPRRWQAADAVIIAAVALVAGIVGIFVLLCFQGYDRTLETTKERAEVAASVVAEQTRWVFAAARSSLDQLQAQIGDDPASATRDQLARFERAITSIPMGMRIGLYDPSGTLLSGGPTTTPTRTSINEKDWFQAVVDGAPWALSAQERNPANGDAVFAVVRRLGGDDQFTGAAVAIIDASVLRRLAESQDLGDQSTISILRSDGWIIARNPQLDAPMDVSESTNFQLVTHAEQGSYVSDAYPADGVARIVGFRHVPELGYIAIASISKQVALAGLWNAIWVVSLLIAPIAAALLIGSLVTARLLRRTEATSRSLAAALEHNDVLFREIHHRVKNNLQSVNSLVQLQPIPREVKADMNQRINAMSAVHEHIYRSHTFERVQVKGYLHTLVENIRAGHDRPVEVTETIEDLEIDKDAATPLGLIVNEVVSNAFKHAFNDGRAGIVEISLTRVDENTARLTVQDNGVGFDPTAPVKGIGRRLITGLSAQLRGEQNQTSGTDGSVFTLTFPLSRN